MRNNEVEVFKLKCRRKKVNNIFLVFMLHLKPEKLVDYMSVTVIHICY